MCLIQELEDDPTLNSTHRKQMYEERKRELLQQQRQGERDHLQILKTIAEQDIVEFRQRVLHERQLMEKQLLREVCILHITTITLAIVMYIVYCVNYCITLKIYF